MLRHVMKLLFLQYKTYITHLPFPVSKQAFFWNWRRSFNISLSLLETREYFFKLLFSKLEKKIPFTFSFRKMTTFFRFLFPLSKQEKTISNFPFLILASKLFKTASVVPKVPQRYFIFRNFSLPYCTKQQMWLSNLIKN